MKTADERFWEKVSKNEDGCWEWIAGKNGTMGYGSFSFEGRQYQAHRWIYEQLNGKQAVGIEVCHHCDNPKCVRPDHLFVGTKSDNMLDCASKGRNAMQRNPQRSRLREGQHLWQAKGERQGHAKLTQEMVLSIRGMAQSGVRVAAIAEQYGVHPAHIRKLVLRKAWGWLA